MKSFVIYKASSGEIIKSVMCPDDIVDYQYNPSSEACIELEPIDDSLFYILSGNVERRPDFNESINGTLISGLPIPTLVSVNGFDYQVDDGEVDLNFSLPGRYIVKLSSFPYVEKIIEVVQL